MRKSSYVLASALVVAAFLALAGAPQAQAPATATVTTCGHCVGAEIHGAAGDQQGRHRRL